VVDVNPVTVSSGVGVPQPLLPQRHLDDVELALGDLVTGHRAAGGGPPLGSLSGGV